MVQTVEKPICFQDDSYRLNPVHWAENDCDTCPFTDSCKPLDTSVRFNS